MTSPLTTLSTPSAPIYLASDYRYSGNDWSGANALLYVVWSVPPVVTNGVVVTPGVPRDLTGCTVRGRVRYQGSVPASGGYGAYTGPSAPITLTGAIVGDPTQGEIALSAPRTMTAIPPQPLSDWGTVGAAPLLIEPMVIGPDGALVSIGLQPLFVF